MRIHSSVIIFVTRTSVAAAVALILATQASPQRSDPFDFLRKDETLSAELTLRLNAEALKDVVTILASATGANISVERDIAEDKVTVFCEGQPASKVMIQIAKLLGYHFRPERRAGKLCYILFRDDATRVLEEKLRRGALDQAFEKIREVVARYAREATTPEGFKRLRESSAKRMQELMSLPEPSPGEMDEELIASMLPAFEEMAFSTFSLSNRGVPLLYSRLSNEQIEILKGERKLAFASYEFPGAYLLPQDLATVLAEETSGSGFLELLGESLEVWLGEEGEADSEAEDVDQAGQSRQPDRAPVEGVRVEFDAKIEENGPATVYLQVTVHHLVENGREAEAASGFLAMPIGVEFAEVMRQELGLYRSAHKPEDEDGAPGQVPSDPIFQTKVAVSRGLRWIAPEDEAADEELNTQEPAIAEKAPASETSPAAIFREQDFYTVSHLIEDLAPQVAVSMIADHYDKAYDPPTVGETFADHIAAMHGYGYELTREHDWFRFRNRSWYLDRPKQTPNHLILRWIATEGRKDGFDLGDVAEMALLSEEQREGIRRIGGYHPDTVFGSLRRNVISRQAWKWIRAFALCTEKQQQRLLKGEGIPVTTMPRAAQDCLIEAVCGVGRGRGSWTLESLLGASFSLSQEERGSYVLLPGASTVPEVAAHTNTPVKGQEFESTLEYLRTLDSEIGAEDFRFNSQTEIFLRLRNRDQRDEALIILFRGMGRDGE